MASADILLIPILLAFAAGTDEDLYVTPPGEDGEWFLDAADFVPDTTVGADGSNYVTLALKNGATSLGSLATSASGWTAGTPEDFTLSGGKSREFTARTDVLNVNVTNTGTGGACKGTLMLFWRHTR